MPLFRKAVKSQSRLRMAIHGLSGSGKTFSSLAIATGLGSRIAVIDSEHGSSQKFADEFDFDVLPLAQFDPRNYIDAIKAAEDERYDVVIIDSLSHEWIGPGGTLEIVDKVTARSNSKNAFTTGWREATPLHNAMIDAMVRCKCHLIATMRVKPEYVITTNSRGGTEPQKIGMAPVQRDNMEYEFDIVGRLTIDHKLIIEKTRYRVIDGEIVDRPGKSFGLKLAGWLSDGVPAGHAGGDGQAVLDPDSSNTIRILIAELRMAPQQVTNMLAKRGVTNVDLLSYADAQEIIRNLKSALGLMPFQELGDHVVKDPVLPIAEGMRADMQPGDGDSGPASAEELVIANVTRPVRDGSGMGSSNGNGNGINEGIDDTAVAGSATIPAQG